jgi:hypothetical protein
MGDWFLSAQLLAHKKPRLMVTDPPYGIELDSEWRDRAGLNDHGPAEPSYMKKRIPYERRLAHRSQGGLHQDCIAD